MPRRPLRPTFNSTDRPRLLDALSDARNWVVRYDSAQDFHSRAHARCDAVIVSIDALAEEVTGDRTYFHLKPHG